MIIVLKPGTTQKEVREFSEWIERSSQNVKVNAWYGEHSTVLGLLGDTADVDIEAIAAQRIVESIKRVQEPYKESQPQVPPRRLRNRFGQRLCNRRRHAWDNRGPVFGGKRGADYRNRHRGKTRRACVLRGGAFKPRTSPTPFSCAPAA